MTKLAVKIPVIESERGWGRKIDDYMVCLSKEDAEKFRLEFNPKNEGGSAPDWYMQVEGESTAIDISDKQHDILWSRIVIGLGLKPLMAYNGIDKHRTI